MALDRQLVQRYLDRKELEFILESSDDVVIVTTTCTGVTKLTKMLQADIEIRPVDETEFFGWNVEEIIESVEGSDYESNFVGLAEGLK